MHSTGGEEVTGKFKNFLIGLAYKFAFAPLYKNVNKSETKPYTNRVQNKT